jgi:hypothetical protein
VFVVSTLISERLVTITAGSKEQAEYFGVCVHIWYITVSTQKAHLELTRG